MIEDQLQHQPRIIKTTANECLVQVDKVRTIFALFNWIEHKINEFTSIHYPVCNPIWLANGYTVSFPE